MKIESLFGDRPESIAIEMCIRDSQDDGDHGRRRGAAAVQRQLGRRQGNGNDLGSDLSRMRIDRLSDGEVVLYSLLMEGVVYGQTI